MPTSACCRPERQPLRLARKRWRQSAAGFTLLEMVVVMVLVGLLAALAVPRLQRVADSVEAASDRQQVLGDISNLGYRAYVLGQGFELSRSSLSRMLRDGSPVLALPPGWQIDAKPPILYSFSGYCDGGNVTLRVPDGTVTQLQLQPPLCHVDPAAR